MEKECLYFFTYYWSEQKETSQNNNFVVPEDENEEPSCIISEDSYENQKFYYKKIFKVEKPIPTGKKSKSKNYYFEFEIEENKYIVSFDAKGKHFIFDVNLEVGKRIINIYRKIDQSQIDYDEKIDIFIEALKKDRSEDLINDFFKEAIYLYTQKKEFFLLISLFLRIYKNKDICQLLLKEFKDMNEKDNENNIDRKPKLKNYISKFGEIIKCEANQLINDYKYEFVEFYGIILCYLNFYDHKNFENLIKELSKKNAKKLFEILFIYHTQFINPLEQDEDFFDKFIEYSIDKKDFQIFQMGLSYIKDIDILIKILEKKKRKNK